VDNLLACDITLTPQFQGLHSPVPAWSGREFWGASEPKNDRTERTAMAERTRTEPDGVRDDEGSHGGLFRVQTNAKRRQRGRTPPTTACCGMPHASDGDVKNYTGLHSDADVAFTVLRAAPFAQPQPTTDPGRSTTPEAPPCPASPDDTRALQRTVGLLPASPLLHLHFTGLWIVNRTLQTCRSVKRHVDLQFAGCKSGTW
jgi:hypothetical protein